MGENRLRAQLKEYIQKKADGEDYPACPRCDGNHYISACEDPDAYRPVFENFPCPLCGYASGDKQIDDAIEWIRDQLELLGVDPDEVEEEQAVES